MVATQMIAWAGAGLAFLVILGVLWRRPPGGWAACLAALAALAALWGPTFLLVGRKSWAVLELSGPSHAAPRKTGPSSLPVGPVAETLRFRLGENQILPPGKNPAAAGVPSWTSLGALLSVFHSTRREGAFLLEADSCPGGLEGPGLPGGVLSWARLEIPRNEKNRERPARVALSAWVPRAPRAGRPWFFLARSGPWRPGTSLELEFSLSPAGGKRGKKKRKKGKISLRAGPGGIGLARVEGPLLAEGEWTLFLRCRGDGKEGKALLSLRVRPAPAVALPGKGGFLSSLLRAQGFRVLSWSGAGPPPGEAEVLAWDLPQAKRWKAKSLLSFLEKGGGLFVLGRGLRALASLPGMAPYLPLEPLPGKRSGEKTGKKGEPRPGPRTLPKPKPRKPPPLPPPPRKPKEPPEKKLARTVSLVLVLDVSGSMVDLLGVVRAACIATARSLDPKDRMGVLAFSSRAVTVVPLGPAGKRAPFLFRLNSLAATGNTLIWPALDLARKLLEKEKTSVKAVLVFTDGMVEWGSDWGGSGKTLRVPETPAETAEDFRRKGISISSVVYGDLGGDLGGVDFRYEGIRILDTLSRVTGGHIYMVKDPSKVVRAFLAEASRVAPGAKARKRSPFPVKTAEKPPPPKRTAPPGPPKKVPPRKPRPRTAPKPATYPVYRLSGGWLTEGLPEKLPPLAWLLPALAKPEISWVPLAAGKERFPLLATVPPALGRVAVWTSDAGEKGAASWVKAGLLGGLLGRTLTSLLPPGFPARKIEAAWDLSGRDLVVRLPAWPGSFFRLGSLHGGAGPVGAGKAGGLELDWVEPAAVRFRLDARWAGRPAVLAPAGQGRELKFLVPPRGEGRACWEALGRKVGALPPAPPPGAGLLAERKPARPYLALVSALLVFLSVLALARFRRKS